MQTAAAVKQVNADLKVVTDKVNELIPGRGRGLARPLLQGISASLKPSDLPEAVKPAVGIFETKIPTRVQLEGSHISMVLRRYETSTSKDAVQLLDTTAHSVPGVRGSTGTTISDYAMFAPLSYNGIYAGEAYGNDGPGRRTVPQGTGTFVGMGTLPPLSDGGTIDAHLRRVRPVGLARLVIVDARTNPGEPTLDDVVFISRAMPMWSADAPTRSFTIARLLFSLRNTPHRRSLRAHWVMYAPRKQLAASMWAEGARSTALEQMAGAYDKVHEVTFPAAIVAHDDAGRAVEVWRNRTGSTNGSPPRILRDLFINTGAPPIDWLHKRRDELLKAMNAESARRAAAIKLLQDELMALGPRIMLGDPDAVRRADEIRKEIADILAAPFPERDAVLDFVKDPLDEKHQPPQIQAGNGLLRTYSAPWLGSVVVPGLLRGTTS